MPSAGWSAGTWLMGTIASSAVHEPITAGTATAAPRTVTATIKGSRGAFHRLRCAGTSILREMDATAGNRPGAESDPAVRVGRAGGYRVWEPGAEAGASTWERR